MILSHPFALTYSLGFLFRYTITNANSVGLEVVQSDGIWLMELHEISRQIKDLVVVVVVVVLLI